ncbi:exonuclease V subunit alpha [Paludibacter propionicigenes WB4]|uniref:Exonuclease V subunit alpha n=1 Tax=Paludibacter propionicigenes (strain DSM 17365 / JCM 13257 / WB4) TaxID=694427 RepID=E4T2Q0_PALPW|nr:AAA family ATPase [Paludibacter propionicigenes]ADQ78994.1 exonuclease V subunit alpha [Paludibacter propionicigenes WB4]
MLQNYIASCIRAQLPFDPTEQQTQLIEELGVFLMSTDKDKAFLLKGYAGTGKTSVVSALVRAFNELKQKTVLLAPTGRAAKVISGYSGFPAFTIHKKIYRQKSMSEFRFQLADNLHTHTLFIVDEASMISNTGSETAFGSGRLLDDLVQFVYGSDGCSLLLLGDTAQLPPVMQPHSPALERDKLLGYGLKVYDFTLTHVVRQALESGILHNATLLRQQLLDERTTEFPRFELEGFSDIRKLSGMELIDEIQRSYDGVGVEDTIVVTRSNKRAGIYNNGIRARVMMKEDELSGGDLLMVTRNNYFWNKPYKEIDFIANGDILQIVRVGKHHTIYDFRFVDLTLRSLDYEWEIDARIWLDALQAESPAVMNEMTNKLFEAVLEDYPEITTKREKYKKVLENEYYNALQVKFAYAVTCHKAQGGQWKKVFVDPGQIVQEQLNSDFYRWLYTALTRASETVYLVNFPETAF